jgi:hypothetical protein
MRRVVPKLGDDALVVQARRLGAAADERVRGANQHVMWLRKRVGHFLDDNVFQTLAEYLLHKLMLLALNE